MRLAIKAAIAAFIAINLLSISAVSCADQGKVKVDSFKLASENDDFVNIEIIVSNESPLGMACINANAIASDGSARTEDRREIQLPVGQQQKINVVLHRPLGQDELQTDALILTTSACYQNIRVQTIKFDWVHIWPKIAPKPFEGAYDETLEFSSRSPWSVFQQHFNHKDFLAADQLLERWNAVSQRDKNGDWKLSSFITLLHANFAENPWKLSQELSRSWLSIDSKSVGGHLTEAAHWQYHALSLKKASIRSEQDPVVEKAFVARINQAEKILIDSKEFATKSPLWYQIYLQNLIIAGRDPLFVKKIFDEAITRHPYYLPLYLSMASYLVSDVKTPNWEAANEIVDLAVKKTKDIDGNKNYSRLYSQLKYDQKLEFDIFKLPSFSWGKMKASFEENILEFPSAANYNNFASFACMAGDKKTYTKLRPIVSKCFIDDAWPRNYSIDVCDHKFLDFAYADPFYLTSK